MKSTLLRTSIHKLKLNTMFYKKEGKEKQETITELAQLKKRMKSKKSRDILSWHINKLMGRI